jgi:hypothetical protein
VPNNLQVHDSPEAAAIAAARAAYPDLPELRARVVWRFEDYDTRVKVWGEDFCRLYGSQKNRPPYWYARDHRVGWVAWGEGIFSVDCTGE